MQTGERATATDEPETTIYVTLWREAVTRLTDQTPTPEIRKIVRLLAHVEEGWGYARELQLLYEARRDDAERGASHTAQLLRFIEAYVIDAFRGLAFSSAAFVPGGSQPAPERIELGGAIDTFAVNASMLYLASVPSTDVPGDLTEIVRPASAALTSWVQDYRAQVARLLPRRRPRRPPRMGQ